MTKLAALMVLALSPIFAFVLASMSALTFFFVAIGCAWRAAKELWRKPC